MANTTVEHDGYSVTSNTETADAMHAAFAVPAAAAETPEGAQPSGLNTDDASVADDAPPVSTAPPVTEDAKRNRREDPKLAIKEARAKERDAERRAEVAERERDELKARMAQPPPPARPAAPAAAAPAAAIDESDPEPNYVDGTSPSDFVKAHSRWAARQEVKASETRREQQWQAQQLRQAAEARWTPFVERMLELRKDTAFAAGLAPEIRDINFEQRTPVTDAIIDSANPKAVLQYLSDHPQDFQRLATLHPVLAIREMARIEERLAAGPGSATAPPVLSNAKPPIPALGGSPHVSDASVDEADLPTDEFIRRGNERDRKNLTSRRR